MAAGVTTVAMESTDSYWIPVKNVLESDRHVVLVCSKKFAGVVERMLSPVASEAAEPSLAELNADAGTDVARPKPDWRKNPRPGELSNRKNRRSRSPFPAAAAKSAGASRDSGRGRLIRIRLSGRCPTAHPQQAPPTIAPPDRNGVREEKQCRTQDVILHLGNIFEANASLYSPGAHTTATSITRRVDSVFSRLLSRPHALHVTPSKDAPKPSC